MTRYRLLAYTTLITVLPLCGSAVAQEKADQLPQKDVSCDVVFEEIIPLRTPDFDQAALWKKTVGIQGIDRPRALMEVADGGVISVGESLSYDEKEGLGKPRLQMLRLDPDGKVLVDQLIDIDGLDNVVDGVLRKTRVVVLSHVIKEKHHYMVMSFLNGAGEKKEEIILKDPARDIEPQNFLALSNGGYVVLAEARDRPHSSKQPYTVVVWISSSGKIQDVKEYLPGILTVPSRLTRQKDGGLLVTGRVETEKGNQAGWLMSLDASGALRFQRPYARGADATLRQAVALQDGSILAIGEALPAGQGDKAAWVIKVTANGDPVWQKFLTGKYAYTGVDVVSLPDGRIMTLWAAAPTAFGGRRFARLVTFSPEGQILSDESFLDGSNAIPFRILPMKDRRMTLGMSETGFATEQLQDELQYVTYDSWIMALQPLKAFDNPCLPAGDRKLDDLP